MAQINFDPNKPGYRSKLTSGELSGNFQALSRANDLRVTEQDPPDLTVRVEAGAYATTSEKTLRYEGGDSDPLDTTTGGSVGQKRVFVLELDVDGDLHWNNDSSWVTPPVVPTVPAYSANRIPLCEVTVTYGDTEIVEDQIDDARPMINLGVGIGQALSPGSVILTATAGQTVFDTSASFTFTPDEILVWSTNPGVSPDPANGLFFRVYGVDYTELSDTTIQFGPSYIFSGGELVVIWKVGLAATPGSIGLADLSNVDGDQEAAFLEADNPISGNPFLTESGHNVIDHLTDVASLADVATHITTAATGSHKHMGDEIQITDPGAFSNATDVQSALEDVDDNIYTPFLEEHNPSGTHGPNVTIDTTAGTDPSLTITQDINAEGLRVDKSHTGGSPAVIISNTGTGSGLQIEQIGEASGEVIVKTATGAEPALLIQNSGATGAGLKITQAGGGSGATIIKTSTGTNPALFVDNSGTGPGISITQSTSALSGALHVQSTGRAVTIDQSGGGDKTALYLNKNVAGAGNIIEIFNGGSGYDIEGHNGNWWIDKNGNGSFNKHGIYGTPMMTQKATDSDLTLSSSSWAYLYDIDVPFYVYGPDCVFLTLCLEINQDTPMSYGFRLLRNSTVLFDNWRISSSYDANGRHMTTLTWIDQPGIIGLINYQFQYDRDSDTRTCYNRIITAVMGTYM